MLEDPGDMMDDLGMHRVFGQRVLIMPQVGTFPALEQVNGFVLADAGQRKELGVLQDVDTHAVEFMKDLFHPAERGFIFFNEEETEREAIIKSHPGVTVEHLVE